MDKGCLLVSVTGKGQEAERDVLCWNQTIIGFLIEIVDVKGESGGHSWGRYELYQYFGRWKSAGSNKKGGVICFPHIYMYGYQVTASNGLLSI